MPKLKWAGGYKHKNKCPDCGSELQEVNKKTDNKKFRRSLIDKVLKTRKNLRSGNSQGE
jgi:transcription initiation factor IIE alpha subunit